MNATQAKPTHSLASAINRPMVTGTAGAWHWGTRYQWAPAFGKWLDTGERVTIRPGEDIPADVVVIDS